MWYLCAHVVDFHRLSHIFYNDIVCEHLASEYLNINSATLWFLPVNTNSCKPAKSRYAVVWQVWYWLGMVHPNNFLSIPSHLVNCSRYLFQQAQASPNNVYQSFHTTETSKKLMVIIWVTRRSCKHNDFSQYSPEINFCKDCTESNLEVNLQPTMLMLW